MQTCGVGLLFVTTPQRRSSLMLETLLSSELSQAQLNHIKFLNLQGLSGLSCTLLEISTSTLRLLTQWKMRFEPKQLLAIIGGNGSVSWFVAHTSRSGTD